jgi:hypothetical protein
MLVESVLRAGGVAVVKRFGDDVRDPDERAADAQAFQRHRRTVAAALGEDRAASARDSGQFSWTFVIRTSFGILVSSFAIGRAGVRASRTLLQDVHVVGCVIRPLRAGGVDGLCARDDGAEERGEPDRLDRAMELSRELVTCDDDSLTVTVGRFRSGGLFRERTLVHSTGLAI